MKRDEIQKEIEKVQKQLQELKEKLDAAPLSRLSDASARARIDAASVSYRDALAAAGLGGVSSALGEVVASGKFLDRGIFLTHQARQREWKWEVRLDDDINSEVLLRVDKKTGKIID